MLKKLLLVLSLFSFGTVQAQEQLAFPGADGFGKYTTGGRGGKVIKVTNLNDSGAGSLRAAIEASGARTVVFEVSGNIVLTRKLQINNGDITIAGQTAPGDGICIQNYELNINANNVIIRYLRFRMGDLTQNEQDALWGRYKKNIIIDHCSMSWSIDETSSFYANKDFTMQWCILSESLNRSAHDKGDHGYGGIWGGDGASFHHNLLAHHNSRNPRFNGYRSGVSNGIYPNELVDFRNNVIYNWKGNSSYGGENGKYNIVNNYYKPGPATTSSSVFKRIMQVSFESNTAYGAGYGTFYIDGNVMHNNATVTANNWNGGVDYDSSIPTAQRANVKRTEPYESQLSVTQSATEAFEAVLAQAGASYKRDAVDARVVSEVRNGTFTYRGANTNYPGIIDSQADVGGWPVLQSLPAPADTDNDGMPDTWETANGLNPNDAADRNGFHASGYTNLEMYMNSLVAGNVTALPQESQVTETIIYPNPFTAAATIAFAVKQQGQVSVTVTDITGKQVVQLLNSRLTPGAHSVQWNGTDANGNNLTSGMYFVSIQLGDDRVVKRVALIRE
ncbi:T9SS type A sorting domain-containing protein [Botryobacter ruber]|uniref:T9SS type A sorting domain-containing protein n=1 Tax=Botryobacter ruber TaxID=2171629 RepID=UPI0013E3DD1E|nr:T9SS type A sorting domain-containing protein [Botryobacter ruber]